MANTYTITINGTVRPFQIETLNIVAGLNARKTMDVEINSQDGTFRAPQDGEIIVWYHDESLIHTTGSRVFGGILDQPKERAFGTDIRGTAITNVITATDFAVLADWRIVFGATIPAGTLKAALQYLITNYLGVLGITLDGAQVDGPALSALVLDFQTAAEFLNSLTELTDYVWRIDNNKVLRMFLPGAINAPFNVATGDGNVIGDIEVEYDSIEYANNVIVRYMEPAVKAWLFLEENGNVADGEEVVIGSRTYKFESVLTNVNGHVLIGANGDASLDNLIAAITAGGGSGVIYAAATEANTQVEAFRTDPGWIKLRALEAGVTGNNIGASTNSPNFRFYHEGNIGYEHLWGGADEAMTAEVVRSNAGEIAARNYHDAVLELDDVYLLADAQAAGDAFLAKSILARRLIRFKTFGVGLEAGQLQTFNVPERNLNNINALIINVTIANNESNQIEYIVEAVESTTFQGTWRDYYLGAQGGTSRTWTFSGSVVGGSGGGTVLGSGTANSIPRWIDATTLGNSIITQTGSAIIVAGSAQFSGSVVPTATATWDVGSSSARWATVYGVAGNFSGTIAANLFSGSGASLTSIPGGQLTGTIPAAVIAGRSIADLGTRSAGDLSSGTLLAARMPALTGDVTTVAGAVATTLATVNSNVGSFGGSTAIPTFTVNAKGLITAASTAAVIAPAGTLTGTTLAANVVTSSLTSVGTITSGVWNAGAITSSGAISGASGAFAGALSAGSVSSSLIPTTTDTYDLGRYDKLWNQAFISTLNAVVYQTATATLFGGYSKIGKQAGAFAADVASAATTINFGQTMTPGNWVEVRAHDSGGTIKVEYILVGSLVSGTTYNVTRDLAAAHGTDPSWASGTPFLVLGVENDGRIEMLAVDGKPRIVFIQQGSAFNTQKDRAVIGNLNSYYGYATDVYGLAAGDAAAANVTVDPVNGFRIRHGTTNKVLIDPSGNAYFVGDVTASSGTIGGFAIGADYLRDATNSFGLASTVTGSDDVRFWAGATFANRATAPFRMTEGGVVTLGTGGSVNAGGVTLDSTGLFISPVSASGGGAYANANAIRWTTDTTARTAIWRSDDPDSGSFRSWNFDNFGVAGAFQNSTWLRTKASGVMGPDWAQSVIASVNRSAAGGEAAIALYIENANTASPWDTTSKTAPFMSLYSRNEPGPTKVAVLGLGYPDLGGTNISEGTLVTGLYVGVGGSTIYGSFGVTGLFSATGFGAHSFIAGGTGYNNVTIRNTTAGTGNGAYLAMGNDNNATLGLLVAYSSTFTTSGRSRQAGVLLDAGGPGGLSLVASATNASIYFHTNSAVQQLEINASGNLILNAGRGLYFGGSATADLRLYGDATLAIARFGSGGYFGIQDHLANTIARFTTTGLGIGMVPNYQIELSLDSAGKPTSSTWTIVSDRRTKRNIKPWQGRGLDIVMATKLYEFEYNGLFNTPEGERGISAIADEVAPLMPRSIRPSRLRSTQGEEVEILGWNPHEFIMAMGDAIKMLKQENDMLQHRVIALERRGGQ